jgi:hypothetical protein
MKASSQMQTTITIYTNMKKIKQLFVINKLLQYFNPRIRKSIMIADLQIH